MTTIAATLPPSCLDRLKHATRGRHQLIACDDWAALVEACEREHPRIAIVDLFGHAADTIAAARALKDRHPRLAVIGYVTAAMDRLPDAFEAGRQGMDGLVVANQTDSPLELLAAIAQAESRALTDVVRRALGPVDPVFRDALIVALNAADDDLSSRDLAEHLGMAPRTLGLRLKRSGVASPRALVTWARLIVAAHMMEERHRSADRVAALLGFPSGSAFRNTCQRYVRATPSEIRVRGGAQYVIRVFQRQTQSGQSQSIPPRARRLALAL